jgi:DNA-binding protein H-NS
VRAPAIAGAKTGLQLGLFDAPPASAVRPVRPAELPVAKSGGRPEVRFRHPEQPGMAWTGRGKPPRWITEWAESGKSLEELRIPRSGT